MATENLLEILSELEHEQWMRWSRTIVEKEKLSATRILKWKKLWVPYSKLSEEDKEQDRVWARKVLGAMGIRHCRKCGCTEEFACEGGCSWIAPDLCSACVKGDG